MAAGGIAARWPLQMQTGFWLPAQQPVVEPQRKWLPSCWSESQVATQQLLGMRETHPAELDLQQAALMMDRYSAAEANTAATPAADAPC